MGRHTTLSARRSQIDAAIAGEGVPALSPQQELFCIRRARGMSREKAYRESYPEEADDERATIAARAHKLELLEQIHDKILELREQARQEAMMDNQTIQAKLTRIALDEREPTGNVLKALDMLAKMQGAYSENVNLNVQATLSLEEKKAAVLAFLGEEADVEKVIESAAPEAAGIIAARKAAEAVLAAQGEDDGLPEDDDE